MPIEFGSVTGLVSALGKVPTEVAVELRPALLKAADLIASRAQVNASWSDRIPGAISTSSSLTRGGGALIRVDQVKAPHARPYEGRGSRGGFFRHPVFPNPAETRDQWTWVPQATRPFLKPARDSEGPAAVGIISAAVRDVTNRLL